MKQIVKSKHNTTKRKLNKRKLNKRNFSKCKMTTRNMRKRNTHKRNTHKRKLMNNNIYMKKYMKKYNKQYGGESGNRPNGIMPDVIASDTSGKNAIQKLASEQQSHSDAIKAMGGGSNSGGRSVGIPCCKSEGKNADYTYPCPDGKCGPLAQFPNDSNGIISKVLGNVAETYTGTKFNAEFDSGSNLW